MPLSVCIIVFPRAAGKKQGQFKTTLVFFFSCFSQSPAPPLSAAIKTLPFFPSKFILMRI